MTKNQPDVSNTLCDTISTFVSKPFASRLLLLLIKLVRQLDDIVLVGVTALSVSRDFNARLANSSAHRLTPFRVITTAGSPSLAFLVMVLPCDCFYAVKTPLE